MTAHARLFAPFEWMIATRYLRARRGRRLCLRHRRLFLSRHHAGRRHSDRRHVGDERLSQGTARQDRRHQRPYLPAGGGYAAHRLRRRWLGARPACPASISPFRWSKARPSSPRPLPRTAPAFWCAASPGPTSSGCPGIAGHVTSGTLDGFDSLGRRRHRPEARGKSQSAGRRQDQDHHRGRRADAVRRRAAGQGLSDHRDLPDRHGGIRQHLRLYAAARGAGLLQQGQAGQRRSNCFCTIRKTSIPCDPRSRRR